MFKWFKKKDKKQETKEEIIASVEGEEQVEGTVETKGKIEEIEKTLSPACPTFHCGHC